MQMFILMRSMTTVNTNGHIQGMTRYIRPPPLI